MASVEQNKPLMHSYIEQKWNKGDLDFVDKNFSSDFVNHGAFPGQPTDCDGVKWVISNIRNAIPGVHFTIEDMIAEGDNAVTKWLAKRAHKGDLMRQSLLVIRLVLVLESLIVLKMAKS
jgi:predicted ester cyclase